MNTSGDVEHGSCWQMVERPFIVSLLQAVSLAQCSISQQQDQENLKRNGRLGNQHSES